MERKTLYLPLTKSAVETGTLVGYASVFSIKDLQGDIVPRGAFTATLKGWGNIRQFPAMLWQHAPSIVCGNWLSMKEDAIGLFVRGTLLPNTPYAAAVKSGAVNGLSIGYRVDRSRYDDVRQARILEQISLEEISLVTLPANPAARVTSIKEQA